MIGLNKIGLNQVQLNRLRLNAPFPTCREMAGGGGSGDGFPQLPGDVTRWYFGGLTNEMMAAMDDPRIEDADHKGRFLSFKNFAWKGMSGVDGYADNFANWSLLTDRADAKITTSSFFISSVKKSSNSAILRYSKVGEIVPSIRIKVSGLIDGMGFVYMDSLTNIILHIPKDGIYTLPSYTIESGVSYTSIKFDKIQESCNITIEQLPLYPGALVFDGVDDYGVCDNFPILTKEKGYTVVALRQWITRGEGALGLVSNVKNWLNNGAFLLEYRNIQADHLNKPISFGAIGSENDLPHILTYQTSKSYNGVSITTGNFEGTDVLHVGKLAPTNVGTCINAAIWELVFLDHDATEEELTKIKDYFVKTYPWLFPDQAWTVVGKTNEDEDRATIANITGNGNDLVLSNFGFAEGSGYGLYAYNFNSFNLRDNVVKPTDVKKDSFRIIGTGNSSNVLILTNESDSANWKIRITGMKDGDYLLVGNANKRDDYVKITKDGTYTFQKQYAATFTNGIWYNSSQEVDVLVEQIPEYEGYLVTDGVDDIASSNTIIYEADFTFIGEWKFIQKDDTVAGINSSSHLYIQNRYNRGATVMINSTFENKKNITDYMTFKAITSKGKAYDENWNEVDLLYGDGYKGTSGVNIGGQGGTEFCHMIFKNMALYMNKVFSKDDCIKAYNYLQTLKAK